MKTINMQLPSILILAITISLTAMLAAGSTAPNEQLGPFPVFTLNGAPTPVGPMTGRPTLADLDDDGDLDVIVACGPCCGIDPDPLSGHIQVLLNDGSGTLTHAGHPIKLGPTTLGNAVGDVNHDGKLDIVVHEHSSYVIRVLLGLGDGGFQPPLEFVMFDGESPHVHSVVLADVNHDDHPDILATLVDDHALSVLLGDGTGHFTPALAQPYFAHQHPYAQLNITDITGDGHADAILTDMRGGGLTVLAGSGTGMFASSNGFRLTAHTPIGLHERPMACDLGDIDSDGDLDAVAVFDESPLAARMINQGRGLFVEPDDSAIELAGPATGIRLVDVTGDGVLDVVSSSTMVDFVSISAGKGDGTFTAPVKVPAGGRNPSPAVGDMDGDGHRDIVTGNFYSGTVSVLINQRE